MSLGRGYSFTLPDITLEKKKSSVWIRIKIRKAGIETDPETKIINIINCDQSIACIMPKHIKMNKNIMGTLSWKVTKLISVDQTQIIMLYLLGKLYAKSKLFGLTKY